MHSKRATRNPFFEDHKIDTSFARDPGLDEYLPIIRFDDEYKGLLKFWKMTGVCPVKWDEDKCEYVSRMVSFMVFYLFVILLILSGFCLSMMIIVSDLENWQVDDLMHLLIGIIPVTVVPSFQAYCAKLFYTNLPKVLVSMGHLTYITREHRPQMELQRELITFKLLTRKRKTELLELKMKGRITYDDIAYFMPKITIVFGIVASLSCTVSCIVARGVNESCLLDWCIFLLIMTTGIFFPTCISSFSVNAFSWMKTSYEAVKIKFEHMLEENLNEKSLKNSEMIFISKVNEILREYQLLHSSTQEIFQRILRFPMTVNILTFVLIAITCFIMFMPDYDFALLFIPMIMSVHFILLLCFGAEKVYNQV